MSLADAQARALIETALGQTLFVEAGAGTGKTTALVRRLANLVTHAEPPLHMREVVAITFTEKAAAELRDRLRQELERRAREAGDVRAKDAVRTLEEASIGTIHAFARSLLARYAIEAGLPPGFTLLDEAQSALRREAWWQETKEDLLSDPTLAKAWGDALDQGLTLHRVRGVAFAFALLGPDTLRRPFDESAKQVKARYANLLESAQSLVARCEDCLDREDKLVVSLRELEGWLGWAMPVPEGPDALDAMVDVLSRLPKPPHGASGAKGKWTTDVKSVREAAKAFFREAFDVRAEVGLTRISPILNRIAAAAVDERERRIQEGRLEFEDLLSVSCQLLRDNASVRQQLFERFRCLLVDEFQDTDPRQVELLMRLASVNGDAPDFHWSEATVPEGKLFFVGDPKQSIYRFRGADVTVYETVRNSLGAAVARLTVNFRSTRGVLDVVNATFSQLFQEKIGQAQYVALDPRPEAVESGPNVTLFGFPGPRPGLRRREAEDLAERIAAGIRGTSPWRIAGKPARYGDVTILFPTRASLAPLERALQEHQVPYRIDSQSLLYDSQEFRDLTNLVAAIEDPTDEVAVVAALRSPAFAITDLELQRHVGSWDPREARTVDSPVGEALRRLADWHRDRERPVAELLDEVIRERRLMESAACEPRPRDLWRRIHLFLEHARQYDASTHGPLRGFLVWLNALRERETRTSEAVLAEDDDDAVRLMTIHASKGLEFPIVALVGLGTPAKEATSIKAWAAPGRNELYIDDRHYSFGAKAQRENDKEQDALESDRLLYVAATRARHELMIGMHGPDRKTQDYVELPVDRLRRIIPEHLCRGRVGVIPMAPEVQPKPIPVSAGRVAEERARWQREREAAIAAAMPPRTWAPTSLAKAVAAWVSGQEVVNYGVSRPTGGPDLGRAVHTVLQTIDLGAPVDAPATRQAILAQAAAERQPESRVEELVRAALDSPVLRAVAGGPHWREVFASANIEGVLVEGYLDLVARLGDGRILVIDYKTDAVSTASEVRQRMATYRFQAATYALLLEAHLRTPPSAAHFLFLAAPEVGPTEVPALSEAMAQVRAFLRDPRHRLGPEPEWEGSRAED